MAARTIEIPDFDFSTFYYPDILRALIQFQRANVPEITDESDEEPFQQLLRAYALVGHLNNVKLDISANESLLPTSRLLESVRGHLSLIDVRLEQAAPAQVDLILEFSKVFDVITNIVPVNSQFATVETDESPQIIYETNESVTIQPTNAPTAIYAFKAGGIRINTNTFGVGAGVQIGGFDFRPGVEFAVGADIEETTQNLTDAINNTITSLGETIAALFDGTDLISVIPTDEENIEALTISGSSEFDTTNMGYGADKKGLASTDGILFNLFDSEIKQGDMIYIGHSNIMWDTVEWLFNTFGSGIELAVEFYDGVQEDSNPDGVTNLGSNLEFDLTELLGTANRKGTVVRAVYSPSGAQETIVSQWDGTKNIARTAGLLGQAVVSTEVSDYVVGTLWDEVESFTDVTGNLSDDGKMSYSLPQTQTQNWTKNTRNGVSCYWLRLRVISVSSPVNPSVDRIYIDSGKQYLLVKAVQGQTVVDAPLGSSNGAPNQEFELTHQPLIEGTLTIEVDEGAGFQAWNSKENFLASNSASKDYTFEISGDDVTTITFGDGKQGKIPTPGVDNIRAIYRIGADQDGNVGSRTVKINKSGISFINRVFNPRQAKGWSAKEGSTDEDLARLKIEGPATLRTRNRALSTPDFEFLATQFTSSVGSKLVSRAKAIEETFGVKTVEVVVVGPSGILLTEAERNEIRDYFNGNKPAGIEPVIITNHEATIVNYTPRIIDVDCVVTGGNEEQIKNAITALLNPDATFNDGVTKRWDFGQEVPLSLISAAIFEVDKNSIKKVVMNTPSADIQLDERELPLAGTVTVSVI